MPKTHMKIDQQVMPAFPCFQVIYTAGPTSTIYMASSAMAISMMEAGGGPGSA